MGKGGRVKDDVPVVAAAMSMTATTTTTSGKAEKPISEPPKQPMESHNNNNNNNNKHGQEEEEEEAEPKLIHRFYRGGMQVCKIGMTFNIFVPFWYLCPPEYVRIFLATWACHMLLSIVLFGMRRPYCIILVPFYCTSMFLALTLQVSANDNYHIHPVGNMAFFLGVAILLAIYKVGVCMSVCLHRYAAHAAFKCHDITSTCVHLVGCLANQGGPIWWASQHRCHHKHCDLPRDPHAAIIVGTERAFSFFIERSLVEEEFAPKHCDNWFLRLIDTYAFGMVSLEFVLAYQYFGREGLFVAYTSAWICQTITLWFNVANHPEDVPGTCKASDIQAKPTGYYPTFWLLNAFLPLFVTVVGESNHQHHHDHFNLAKRGPYDLAYYVSIAPLEYLGLVWDVKYLAKQI